jgi:hypothetical protein
MTKRIEKLIPVEGYINNCGERLFIGDTVYRKSCAEGESLGPFVIKNFQNNPPLGVTAILDDEAVNKSYCEYKGPNIDILTRTEPVKKPLFTTEDGVEIFKGDEYHSILINSLYYQGKYTSETPNYGKFTNPNSCKTFSTKETAEEYILMNKPCLSINDVLSMNQWNLTETKTSTTNKLKKLVKSKK